MHVVLVSRGGTVYLYDQDTGTDLLALQPIQAVEFSHFLQVHLISELIVQLRLAAQHAEVASRNPSHLEAKEFQLKRG